MALRPTQNALSMLGLLAALASTGCRAQTVRATELSDSAVTLALPAVAQDDSWGCGVASIDALCRYWGVALPAETRAELARTAEEEQGLSGGELCAALENVGMEVFLFHGTLDREVTGLYRHVDAGRPPLVMLSPDRRTHHYCLVLGYDEPRANVILLDPATGPVARPIALFEREWESCQRFTLLACPVGATRDDEEQDEEVTRAPAAAPALTPNREN